MHTSHLLTSLCLSALTASYALARPSTSDEGCTPGYWRNHVERWDGLGTDDFTQAVVASLPFNLTFGVGAFESGIASSTTLIEATSTGGGDLNALARHAAAALASADSVSYPLTVGEVIDLNRSATVGSASVTGIKDLLASFNELGCPLSNSTPPPPKIFRLPPIMNSGPNGAASYGPGLVAISKTPLLPAPGGIQPGDTWYMQAHFCDMSGCGNGANTSNSVMVTFVPGP